MATEIDVKQIERLRKLKITIEDDFVNFLEYFNKTDGSLIMSLQQFDFVPSKRTLSFYNEAMEYLDSIEDSIKRFRENRPQKYE